MGGTNAKSEDGGDMRTLDCFRNLALATLLLATTYENAAAAQSEAAAPAESLQGDLVRQFADLKRQVAELESRLAIQQVITSYGLAADTNNIEAMMRLWSDDCVIEIDGIVIAQGRDQSRRIIDSEIHRSIQPYSAHVMGPFRIDFSDPDHAVATGYQTVYVREGQVAEGRSRVWRQSFGRWEMRKTAGRWEIARRQSRAVSHPGVGAIIEPALREQSDSAQ